MEELMRSGWLLRAKHNIPERASGLAFFKETCRSDYLIESR